jgi:cytochrome c-type biogenesis protein CcmH
MLWLALTALAACAGALIALPFLRQRPKATPETTPIDIFKAQLDELSRDEAAGELDADAAAALRTEVERRIAQTPPAAPAAAPAAASVDRFTAIAVAVVVVLGAAVLYSATGDPSAPSAARGATPAGPAQAQAGQALPDVDTMIARLRQRLEAQPNDAEGWRMLGWSYFETNQFPQSVEAYRRAVALSPNLAAFRSAYGEALVSAANGSVTPAAREAFRAAIARAPKDERARFFLALAKAQNGDAAGAINDWIAALREAPPDSEWSARMRSEAQSTAQRAGINIAARLPPAPIGAAPAAQNTESPPPEVVAQVQQMNPEARQQMILGMVDGLEQRLAQSPRDAEGWVRLMRSRMVLGQPDRAQAALARALAVFADDRATQAQLRAAAADLNVPGRGG